MNITIEKIPVDKATCRRIEVVCGEQRIEISQLDSHDLDGPGDVGIIPNPMSLSLQQVQKILKAAPKHRLIQTALQRLQNGTADFYGHPPSRSVAFALESEQPLRKIPRRSLVALPPKQKSGRG